MARQRSWQIIVLIVALVAIGLLVWRQRHGPKRTTPSVTSATTFHDIPPEGSGGDPELNRHKNRWSEPASYTDMSVPEIIAFDHSALDDAGRKQRSNWSEAATTQAAKYEQMGVRVEGYLIAAKQSGAESCNGESETYRDDHLWLAASADDQKRDGLVVEVTPYWNERHPEWDLKTLTRLAREHTRIRVSGWILWDEEHADEVGKSRGSQWEIHPITRIEVTQGNGWQLLSAENPL